MMKLHFVRTFHRGIKPFTKSGIVRLISVKLKTVFDKGHVTNRYKNDIDLVNTNGIRTSNIQCERNIGSFLGVPINRAVVCGAGELTQCPIRLLSSVPSNVEDDMKWEGSVDYSRLSPKEREIHELHKKAVMEKQQFYVDPLTGYQVMTRHAHLKRGDCCGTACRHCPYRHKNVPDDDKTMIFNSAFYVRRGQFDDT